MSETVFMDHDQRFKVLLREFPEDFFRLFFPRIARQFDFSRLEWIETELFPDPPEGERRAVDLVAKLPLREPRGGPRSASDSLSELLALIHIEVESSESPAEFGRRMLWYYMGLRQRHNLPVLPVAVFLKSGRRGIGGERHVEKCGTVEVVRFDYRTVSFRWLESLQYLKKRNRLAPALSALMDVPVDQRAEVKLKAYDRIAQGETNKYQRFLLLNCVDAYLRLNAGEKARFEQMLHDKSHRKAEQMVQTVFEQREEIARRDAQQAQSRRMILVLLEDRHGTIPGSLRRRIDEWPADDLENLFRRILRTQSLEEAGL